MGDIVADTGIDSEHLARLSVDAASLRDATAYLKKNEKKKVPLDVIWGFDGEYLTLQMGATQASAPAQGMWTGIARCSIKFAVAATSVVSEDTETVIVRVESNKLYVGNSSVSCLWEDKSGSVAYAPQEIDLEGLLALRLRYTQQEMEEKGLINRVLGAEHRRNAIVSRAAKILVPLGITRQDLLEYIEGRLKRRYPQAHE